MRLAVVRGVLAAAALCAAGGPGCNDVTRQPPGPAEPPAGEVWGRMVGADGAPAWDGPPIWIGAQQTAVRNDGTFQFSGVQLPYDLVLGGPNVVPADANSTVLYQGVTSREPVVRLSQNFSYRYGGSAYVTGRVPYVPRWSTRIIVVTSDGRAADAYADRISSAYDLETRWGHGETNRVTLYALRYDQDNVLQDRYVRTLSLKDDERRVVDLEHAVFSPAPTVFLNGSLRTEPYTPSRAAELFASFGRISLALGSTQANARFPDAFSFDVPYFPGATYQVKVHAAWSTPEGTARSDAYFADVRSGAPVHAVLHPGPGLFTPPNGATNIDMGRALRWSPAPGASGIYRLRIRGYAGLAWSQEVKIYTARTDIVLTQIPALQLFMRPGATYYWSVDQLPACPTVDAALAGRMGEEDTSAGPEHRFSTVAAAP